MKNNNPLVSIITVTYNASNVLEKTILNVFEQQFDNYEIIIIDGNSVDNTVDIIKKYESKINYWVSETDAGIYDAMNKGITQANGEWLIFMNAGDTFYSSDTLSQVFNKNIQAHIIAGNYYLERDKSVVEANKNTSLIKCGYLLSCHQALLFNKNKLGNDIFYNTEYRICADNDIMMRIIKNGFEIHYTDEIICSFEDGGISSENKFKSSLERYYAIYSNFGLFQILKTIFKNKVFK